MNLRGVLCAFAVVGLLLALPSAGRADALARLDHRLSRDLAAAGGTHSALVVDIRTGRTLFASGAGLGQLPASVQKLYTTSTALITFGPDGRLTTDVLGVGSLRSRTWHGTLYLRGDGDPTFGSASFIRAAYDGTGASVQQLVGDLREAGIRAVDGRIVGDETVFDDLRGTPATGYEPSLYLEGELSGLSFNAGWENADEDSLQPRPALFAADAFAAALRAGGISVPRRTPIYARRTPAAARLLAGVDSPTMTSLVELTNSPSDNFFAETLLKDVGVRLGHGGTTADGAAVVRRELAEHFGIHPRFDDGSGLSRYDLTSADQVVSLLRQQAANPAFVDSLAVAGVSGTMEYEMRGTRGADNCRGKTGTLFDVANLVGYCTAENGDPLAFAFLLNDQSDVAASHAIEDRMGEALADYDP